MLIQKLLLQTIKLNRIKMKKITMPGIFVVYGQWHAIELSGDTTNLNVQEFLDVIRTMYEFPQKNTLNFKMSTDYYYYYYYYYLKMPVSVFEPIFN